MVRFRIKPSEDQSTKEHHYYSELALDLVH
jgi:hypothetical protein